MPESFITFIGIVDALLLGLLVFLALGITVTVILKKRSERKRLHGLTALVDTLRTLAILSPDSLKNTCPALISKTDFTGIFQLTQNIDAVLPHELEQQVKECLSVAQIASMEKIAKSSWNKWKRIEAFLILGFSNPRCAMPILQKSLLSKDEDISYFSMIACGRIHTVESARVLLDFLGKHIFSGQKIVSLLEHFPPFIIREAGKKLDHPDPLVRFWVLKLLIKFKPAIHLEKIIQCTCDADADVRSAACECLAEIGLPEARRALIPCLEDQEWFVRMHAVRALHKIEGIHCLAEVIGLINDSAWLVKESVKQIMIKDIEATLSHIGACLREGDQESQKVCVGALVDSGYIKTLLSHVLSQEAAVKDSSIQLLTLLINSKIHFGLKKTLDTFEENDHKKILEVVYTINKDLVGQLQNH